MAGTTYNMTDPMGNPTGYEGLPPLTDNFNYTAAQDVYKNAGTLKSFYIPLYGDVAKPDATIKASSVKTNLEAIYAGFKDKEPNAASDIERFGNTILKHKDLREGMDALLKDEGAKIIPEMQKMLTGNGKIDAAQFEKAMENPAYRKVVANMLKRVGTSELGADYTTRFTTDAMDAMNNPDDIKKREKFLETAKVGGVDTSGLQQQEMMKMVKDFWQNPDKMIVGMLDKMNLSPELKNSLAGIMSGLAGFMKDIVGHYAFGDGQQPGMVQIARNAYENSQISGSNLRRQHGSIDPVIPAEPVEPVQVMNQPIAAPNIMGPR